ncbi:arsenical pump-driving ATPase [Aeromicrobium ponti]|uniref:Arsenite efflux ATP-binding protein ArsA (TC 3.A.4.1.1) n=1 Tax=Cytobacillus oceanisediminis TaxID=665099 RepID=A0A562JP66_9BACI|nr:arsenical pump-driving ATPase [Cytobacillus oceanisediminis]TWH84967.1 arsenite efflux ATP-binding protein ArsA (TC 3.A.4.1.1) [Cytobacillus oceanisediminis]
MLKRFDPAEITMTPFMFFTGKGGVGKTSTASALAITLADQGKKVLIVSTDPASNLQDVFKTELTNNISAIPDVNGLFACNLDPEEAARAYRERTIGPYRGKLPESVVQTMEEQLSGACTVEIAAFDEFTNLLANPEIHEEYDHIIFDTAPTGHTLRLLQLPAAWTDFLNESTHGASCLGPLSGLSAKKDLYANSLGALSDREKTTLILVSRPEASALAEADRASNELCDTGIKRQLVLINGVLKNELKGDSISEAFYRKQQKALCAIPAKLAELPLYAVPLIAGSLTGPQSLRKLFTKNQSESGIAQEKDRIEIPSLQAVLDDLHESNKNVIFTMGKGGVGKTTAASAIAVGLAEKGKRVHLTTTDPASHLTHIFGNEHSFGNLTISSIDPKYEVEKYRKEVLSRVSAELDEEAIAYIKEDLESPCTEEIAVFRAFAEVVARAKEEVVVIDTAPTGHTLLLLDAAHSYHKELERSTGEVPESVKELLPKLRNNKETEVVIVTLPEATPVFEAVRLQEDLKRADISPKWWVINQSFYALDTEDPILRGKAAYEKEWILKVKNELAKDLAVIPWLEDEQIGYSELLKIYEKKG